MVKFGTEIHFLPYWGFLFGGMTFMSELVILKKDPLQGYN
ncbi:hypothetical protein LEP1GSC050_2799 [Leptospira broomii serovar Hurstbridge str. 5399]|uniref:Uncharacterized protein n=1 Tax=Leptospira broomii serovar Hurstbridge str. 5399 TaxID=1049789 RepID=T0FCD1_9LEPT|nr:hypothetical protein LEP1GSC050_2799 [Leptospira broomii serovar Hurstbridge str. 5399]